jgi:surface polysaccharide O-acyltransferase-like enzyme
MIIWLYLLTPYLRRFVRRATPGQRWGLIAIILLLASAYSFTNMVFWQNKRCLFTFYIPYLGYYLAGYELRRTDPQKVPLRVLVGLVVLCAVYILVQTRWYIEYQGILHGMGVMGFFSPPVMVLSLGVFWAAHIMGQSQVWQPGRWIRLMSRISPATFGIYLCHLAILIGMGKAFEDQAGGDTFLGSVIVGSMLLFLVSWGLVVILLKIPYLRRIV